ncbi:MAG: helix-turn-helix domain-containing protein [Eubacteriales bacterium]|nr:helix-turn-helix domain-containing protein [Eubacteriales bacterium]
MKVLIVDDLPAIVESIKNGVNWEAAGVTKVYTACTAKEAKLLLSNFPVDVLLCDIEMPEENGLELATWAKSQDGSLEIIFLTAHAEFDYIMEAMHLGSFDYVLQPVKFEAVEKVLLKAKKKIEENRRLHRLEGIVENTEKHSDRILELMLTKNEQNLEQEADKICQDYMELCKYMFDKCVVFQMIVDVVRWKRLLYVKRRQEVKKVLENTFLSLFDEYKIRVAVMPAKEESYWILILTEKGSISRKIWGQKIMEFYEFVERNMDFSIAVYPSSAEVDSDFISVYRSLENIRLENAEKTSGIYTEMRRTKIGKSVHPAIREALKYIDHNMNKNLSRTEVAKAVNVSEEYFSRLFRQETGDTFKDYMQMVKMEEAKKLLKETGLSIGIIASKVGYSNFSHFTQMFRSYTRMTPQEYRRSGEEES